MFKSDKLAWCEKYLTFRQFLIYLNSQYIKIYSNLLKTFSQSQNTSFLASYLIITSDSLEHMVKYSSLFFTEACLQIKFFDICEIFKNEINPNKRD